MMMPAWTRAADRDAVVDIIEQHRQADAACRMPWPQDEDSDAFRERERALDAADDLWRALRREAPKSLSGVIALGEYVSQHERECDCGMDHLSPAVLSTAVAWLRRMGGRP